MAEPRAAESDYISTGVPGLDHVLGGGFLRQGFYLLQGIPAPGRRPWPSSTSWRAAVAASAACTSP